jgi:hypothetical protein
VDHPQGGKVEETIARVSLPRVADESLPAPDVAVGTNEPAVAMQPVPSEVPPAPTSDVLLADAAINGTNNETTDTGTPPLETAAPASPGKELQGLLAAGHEAFADHRLLMPPKDSAYHYFRGALRLAPGNREATQGIEQIVQRYIELSTRLLEEQNEPMARRFINRGLRIQPDNATLLALREQSIAPPAPEPVSPEPVKVEPVAPAPVAAPAPVVDDKPFFSRMKDFISDQGRVETAGVAGDPKSSSFVYE